VAGGRGGRGPAGGSVVGNGIGRDDLRDLKVGDVNVCG
jgi:hypothetical protein